MAPHNIKHGEVTHKRPGNGLPTFVKDMAVKRGYADSSEPLSLYVTEEDVDQAYKGAGRRNGSKCVMAQAGTRLGAKNIYFYRTTAWIDFGTGPILRFTIADSIQRNIIDPFDNGRRRDIKPGLYPLKAPTASRSLRGRRKYDKKKHSTKKKTMVSSNPRKKVLAHTDRVVLASQEAPQPPQAKDRKHVEQAARRRKVTPEVLEKVAAIHQAAPDGGRIEAVRAAFGVQTRQAMRYIAQAKEKGLL